MQPLIRHGQNNKNQHCFSTQHTHTHTHIHTHIHTRQKAAPRASHRYTDTVRGDACAHTHTHQRRNDQSKREDHQEEYRVRNSEVLLAAASCVIRPRHTKLLLLLLLLTSVKSRRRTRVVVGSIRDAKAAWRSRYPCRLDFRHLSLSLSLSVCLSVS